MIFFDILKLRPFLRNLKSVFTFLWLILKGDISKKISFDTYPYISNKGYLKINKNVRLCKNISLKISQGAVLIIEEGVIISDNCRITVRSNGSIRIGKGARINNGAIISGNVEISKGVIIAPNVVMISDAHRIGVSGKTIQESDATLGMKLGHIQIKEHAFVGVGATILHSVTLGRKSVIGANSFVMDDVPDFGVVVANKAKKIK